MRFDPIQFAQANESPSKEPRYVVAILYETGSIYCTSHGDIPNVPGIVLEGVLQKPNALSQKLFPDEGRSEIGSFTFTLVDIGQSFTDEMRAKLAAGQGLRRKVVKYWCGFRGDDFTAFQLFQTQVVDDCAFENGVYSVFCSDITREQKKELFQPVFTTLRDSISETATTIPVYVTSTFHMVAHGSWWGDAPSSTVGYIRIENEFIRYTGKTSNTFTGCTRGALNSKAAAHAVDAGTAEERRTKVEEHIYLEMPAVMMALAINTGEIYGTADTLPDHWHLGIDPDFVRESDFTGIGLDLWNPSANNDSLILRFEGLKRTDGKRFLEREIYLVLGCYSPIYSDGTIGLRRLPALISDAVPVVTLTERELRSIGELRHHSSGMHNSFRVNWSYDPIKDAFNRPTFFVDAASIAIHGESPVKEYSFKGLHGSRHTDALVRVRLFALRDAYAYPPLRTSAELFGSLSKIELGDVVRLAPRHMRDFTADGDHINRSFLVVNKSHAADENLVSLELFGSTARPLSVTPGSGSSTPLPDGFYNAAGTALSSVITITGGTMATGSHSLTGNANLTNSGAIYYYLGDLTIPTGCNLTIDENVQLRIRGFLTLNGTINGTGGGKAGVVDDLVGDWDTQIPGNPGLLGNSRGWDGIRFTSVIRGVLGIAQTLPPVLTRGANDVFPTLQLTVSGTSLVGLPTDLRGTGGPPGGRLVAPNEGYSFGGPGGDGGAGLAIICRGMSVGAAGSITLNGANTTAPSVDTLGLFNVYVGAGGPGGPGALLILLDGNAISVPDITGKFFALTGTLTQPGNYLPARTSTIGIAPSDDGVSWSGNPYSGYPDPSVTSAQDWSNSLHLIQHVPETQVVNPDVDNAPAPPTNLAATFASGGLTWNVTIAALPPTDVLEVWTSLDNNRANATLLGRGRTTEFHQNLGVLESRYAWARARREDEGVDLYSQWFPIGSTSGILATTLNPGGWTPVKTNGGSGAQMIVTVSTIEKSSGTAAWDSAVRSAEGYYNGSFLSFRAAQTNADIMVGLNTDPATDATYTGIDYTFYIDGAGNADIRHSGNVALELGAYDTSTTFGIKHDGQLVRYYKNGSVVLAVVAKNKTLYFDSSFYSPGGKLLDVKFGPMGETEEASAETVFLDTFEHQSWESHYLNVDNSSGVAIDYPQNGAVGGRVIRAASGGGDSQLWIEWLQNIPFDPNVLYRITARVRRTAAASNSARERVYLGVTGVRADGVALANESSVNLHTGQHFNCFRNYDLNGHSLDEWVTAVGYFKGNGSSGFGVKPIDDPGPLYTTVRYFRPVLRLNAGNVPGDGTMECDFIKIDRMPENIETVQISPDAVSEILSSSDSATTHFDFNTTDGTALTIIGFTPDVDATVIVRASCQAYYVAGDSFVSAKLAAYLLQPEPSGTEALGEPITLTSNVDGVSVEGTFSVVAGDPCWAGLWALGVDSGGSVSSRLTMRAPTVVVEIIKK